MIDFFGDAVLRVLIPGEFTNLTNVEPSQVMVQCCLIWELFLAADTGT